MDRLADNRDFFLEIFYPNLALEEYGPLAKTVLEDWGITKCSEVGEVVFQLVSMGVLGKNDNDVIEDFEELWSFAEAFEAPFLPRSDAAPKRAKPRTTSPARAKTGTHRSQEAPAPTEAD